MNNTKYMNAVAGADLERVNGGYLYHNKSGNTLDVINDKTGDVLSSIKLSTDSWKRAQNVGDGQRMAGRLSQKRDFISEDQLNQLRRTGSIG